MSIDSFSGENFFLSNFYPVLVEMEGEVYPSVEHAFQAAKTLDVKKRAEIRAASRPGKAKQFGRSLKLRQDWEEIKLDVMKNLLRQKFAPETELSEWLLETTPAVLIEGNSWNDTYWGAVLVRRTTPWDDDAEVPCWEGKNYLGQLLMLIREELIDSQRFENQEPWIVLGPCIHGFNLDREFCPHGCRI